MNKSEMTFAETVFRRKGQGGVLSTPRPPRSARPRPFHGAPFPRENKDRGRSRTHVGRSAPTEAPSGDLSLGSYEARSIHNSKSWEVLVGQAIGNVDTASCPKAAAEGSLSAALGERLFETIFPVNTGGATPETPSGEACGVATQTAK